MGGMGSGHYSRQHANSTTNMYPALDVRDLQRRGLLKPGVTFTVHWNGNAQGAASIQVRTESNEMTLSYRRRGHGKNWKDESYPVRLDWTPCHLGGKRPWFICPTAECGRRVAIIYGGARFACRRCYRLAYSSQRAAAHLRTARRADKIRLSLGWPRGILNAPGWKPKGMHWRTFDKLTAEHDTFAAMSLVEAARWFGIDEHQVRR